MKPEKFEYEPLENVFRGMEIHPQDSDPAELKKALIERGLDPDGTVSAVKGLVADYVKSKRLSWKDAAVKKRSELVEATQRLVSWLTRSDDEVETAFAKLQGGTYGSIPKIAFRNLSKLTIEEKARILDEADSLTEAARQKSENGENL